MLKMKYKLLSALVIAAPLVLNTGVVTVVHACDNNKANTTNTSNKGVPNIERNNTIRPNAVDRSDINYNRSNVIYQSYFSLENFKTRLDTLVTAGTITQEQETIILNLYSKGNITSENFKAQLDVLVTVGTITQSQKATILNLFTTVGSTINYTRSNIIYKSYFSIENFKTRLDTLVTAGTISQDQETIILNLYNKGGITTENFKSELDILVTVGTITQSQETTILNLFTSCGTTKVMPSPVPSNNLVHNNSLSNRAGHSDSTFNGSGQGHKCSK